MSIESSVVSCQSSAVSGQPSAVNRGPFDVVHVEHLRGARYGLHVRSSIFHLPSSIPIVWDAVDCITYLFEQAAGQSRSLFGRLITRLDLPRTRRYEGWLVHQFDRVLATSRLDAEALGDLASDHARGRRSQRAHVPTFERANVDVLPNGVDLTYFRPAPGAGPSTPEQGPPVVVFTGKMSYHANVTAALYLAREIMPLVWAQRPEAQLRIVGKDPTAAVQALTADRRIAVTGAVADMRPHLWSASLAVAPLRYGAGIQNKVLEAMACGTPVVASERAVAALEHVRPGADCLVADAPEGFAAAMLRVLDDPVLQRDLAAAGRAYVERCHDWDAIAGQLEGYYRDACAN